jgi:flagellar motility protein MotE (MotC chaperone)
MKRILGILAAIVLIHALAAGGFVIWFLAARMNDSYGEILGKMLAGESVKLADDSQKPTTRPADEAPATSAEKQADLQKREIMLLQEAAVAYADLRSQQERLKLEWAQLEDKRGALAAEKKRLAEQKLANMAEQKRKGFQQVRELYSSMKARDVKEIWKGLDTDVVVALAKAIEPGKVAKILREFKQPDEVDKKRQILEQIRTGEVGDVAGAAALAPDSSTGVAGRTGAPPAAPGS